MYQEMSLSYEWNALEPNISGNTMKYHFEIYQNYLKRFNQWLKEKGIHKKDSLVMLLKKYDSFPVDDRGDLVYFAGAILNHELYFSNMKPDGEREPVGKLKEALEEQFGSYSNFKEEVKKQAQILVGSGYVFLGMDSNQKLVISSMSNQENSYLYGMVPIMVMDVWEHAYYLDKQYHRDQYVNSFFQVIDFAIMNERYEKALSK